MELEALHREPAADNEINWVTATFMGLFHVGAIAALFFFTWKALLLGSMFLSRWAFGKPGHWYGLPSAAHASRLQNSEVGRISPHNLRNFGS